MILEIGGNDLLGEVDAARFGRDLNQLLMAIRPKAHSIVMLELRFFNPVLGNWHLNTSLATFIANALSVAATSFLTMPLFVRWFAWWLFPKAESAANSTLKGVALVELEKLDEGCRCLNKSFYSGYDEADGYLKEYCYSSGEN